MTTPTRPGAAGPDDRFHTTAWSVVLRAAAPAADARPALADLCRAYWYPLYAYHRRRGTPAADAEDAVQAFFTHLLETGLLRYADPDRGRFRLRTGRPDTWVRSPLVCRE